MDTQPPTTAATIKADTNATQTQYHSLQDISAVATPFVQQSPPKNATYIYHTLPYPLNHMFAPRKHALLFDIPSTAEIYTNQR